MRRQARRLFRCRCGREPCEFCDADVFDQPAAFLEGWHCFERAVFDVTAEGLVLTEVAKGVDVRKHILEQMEFAPASIVDRPKTMDDALFAH